MDSATSSSSSSNSSTSSGSSSCTDTNSSTDTESSSSHDEKSTPANVKQPAAGGRRKSADFKINTKAAAENDKHKTNNQIATTASSNSRTRTTSIVSNQRNGVTASSDDEIDNIAANNNSAAAAKRTSKAVTAMARRKSSVTMSAAAVKLSGSSSAPRGGKQPPATLTKALAHAAARTPAENGLRKSDNKSSSSPNATDDSLKDIRNGRKTTAKLTTTATMTATATAVRAKQMRTKTQVKRSAQTNNSNANKSSNDSDESESGSGSGSNDGSSSTGSDSDEDESDSSNSYSSRGGNHGKQKRNTIINTKRSDTDEGRNPMRKLTRSLSMRRTKQPVKQASDTDSDLELSGIKPVLTKSHAKKPPAMLTNTKCKVKKENMGLIPLKIRPLSPMTQFEKKCPIEGCDSSGHLSGNLDRHFLPEACPIYHNMSASECKERANERKLRSEQRQKVPITIHTVPGAGNAPTNRALTPEQKEFLSKIRESRARFRPISSNMSDKLEKDCTDEDREPNLIGLVPDYDLQLFREAQALASEKIEDELKDLPFGKGIKYITMGKYKMKVWYQSPYPDDAARLPKMYICEFCLRYQKSETGIKRHAQKCIWRHPPGDEIYRKGKLQVWQVDGKRYKQYCQHLCLLAKFFLDHKTLYYDVEPFLFYIMTLADVDGCHIVGYFSKEKNSFYNVSCILTLPPYQRKGYGRLLIDFSYLLTRVEGKIGSPEKPLSDLGLISYRSYWKDVLLDFLCNRSGNTLSIKDVSQEMAIYSYDIVSTLQALGMMKYWKGKHIVLKKQDVLDEYEERVKRRGTFPKIDDSCLRWQPFVPAQMNASP